MDEKPSDQDISVKGDNSGFMINCQNGNVEVAARDIYACSQVPKIKRLRMKLNAINGFIAISSTLLLLSFLNLPLPIKIFSLAYVALIIFIEAYCFFTNKDD